MQKPWADVVLRLYARTGDDLDLVCIPQHCDVTTKDLLATQCKEDPIKISITVHLTGDILTVVPVALVPAQISSLPTMMKTLVSADVATMPSQVARSIPDGVG